MIREDKKDSSRIRNRKMKQLIKVCPNGLENLLKSGLPLMALNRSSKTYQYAFDSFYGLLIILINTTLPNTINIIIMRPNAWTNF